MRPTILLLAKSAIAARPLAELDALAAMLAKKMSGADVTFALSEQGSPSLRQRLSELAEQSVPEIVIVPVLVPMEPGFPAWIRRAVHRWAGSWHGARPTIRLAGPPADRLEHLAGLIGALAAEAGKDDVLAGAMKLPDASIVPAQKHRILVCMGGACNDAGAGALWNHLRSEQDRLNLRDDGEGMMSCKTSCLGPCNLAPVVQVWPEGTNYCGVDEAGMEAILHRHVLGGTRVEDLAYSATGKKQRLRVPVTPVE